MSTVFLKDGETLDSAMRRLKTKVEAEGTIEEFRRIQAYETPKQRRQRKLKLRQRKEKMARMGRIGSSR